MKQKIRSDWGKQRRNLMQFMAGERVSFDNTATKCSTTTYARYCCCKAGREVRNKNMFERMRC